MERRTLNPPTARANRPHVSPDTGCVLPLQPYFGDALSPFPTPLEKHVRGGGHAGSTAGDLVSGGAVSGRAKLFEPAAAVHPV